MVAILMLDETREECTHGSVAADYSLTAGRIEGSVIEAGSRETDGLILVLRNINTESIGRGETRN